MHNWEFLINVNDLSSVLPDEYSHFARPVRGALGIFLEGLPKERQIAILAQQAELPPEASISERLAILARSCPVLHKLGQILARDDRLEHELRQQLQQLESLPSSISVETIREALTDELGPLDDLGITLLDPALAEASVAVVIGFVQKGWQGEQHGVFKILKPGIGERLQQELDLSGRVGEHLDQRCEELQIPPLDYRDTFEQVQEKLQWEIRLDREQEHLKKARSFYVDEPRVHVPALIEQFCTTRVTAMERVSGDKVTIHRLDTICEKRRLARLVVKALIAGPIFSKNKEALFHCDPHAGNLFFTADEKLAILDWSLAGTLGERERIAIVQVMLGAASLNDEQIVRVLADLAERPPNLPALKATIDDWLRRIRQGQFPGISWLIGMLDESFEKAGLRLSTDMLLFRKSLHTLDGVLRDLVLDEARETETTKKNAEFLLIDSVLLEQFLRHFMMEWPQRWLALPNSREFAIRFSNIDITRFLMEMPATAARLYLGQFRDLIALSKHEIHIQKPYNSLEGPAKWNLLNP